MELNAAHVHLMLNHVPILGFAFGLLLIAWGKWRSSDEVVRAALGLFLFVGLVSVAVFFSGEQAEDVVEGVAGVSEDAIEAHEEIAELGMIVSLIVGLASGAGLVAYWKRTLPSWVGTTGLVAGALSFGLLTYAGFAGGQIHHEEIRPGGAPAGGAEDGEQMEESSARPEPPAGLEIRFG